MICLAISLKICRFLWFYPERHCSGQWKKKHLHIKTYAVVQWGCSHVGHVGHSAPQWRTGYTADDNQHLTLTTDMFHTRPNFWRRTNKSHKKKPGLGQSEESPVFWRCVNWTCLGNIMSFTNKKKIILFYVENKHFLKYMWLLCSLSLVLMLMDVFKMCSEK